MQGSRGASDKRENGSMKPTKTADELADLIVNRINAGNPKAMALKATIVSRPDGRRTGACPATLPRMGNMFRLMRTS
jgi:hypothetical protein